MPPFIPANPEVLYIDPVLSEHLADLATRHAGHGVAVHDDRFTIPKCAELSDDPLHLVVCWRGWIGIGRDVDGTHDVFLFVFLRASEVHQDIVIDAFVHLSSEAMWANVHGILCCVKICNERPVVIGAHPEREDAPCHPTDEPQEHSDKQDGEDGGLLHRLEVYSFFSHVKTHACKSVLFCEINVCIRSVCGSHSY